MPPRIDAVLPARRGRAVAAAVLSAALLTPAAAFASTGGTSAPSSGSGSSPQHARALRGEQSTRRGYHVPMSRRERQTLNAISRCESGGNPHAVSRPRGIYRGLYQFDRQTWYSMGGTGDPAHAPVWMQDLIALKLLRMDGLKPWPHCGAAIAAYRRHR